jgi:hypothetical protein
MSFVAEQNAGYTICGPHLWRISAEGDSKRHHADLSLSSSLSLTTLLSAYLPSADNLYW